MVKEEYVINVFVDRRINKVYKTIREIDINGKITDTNVRGYEYIKN